ncbi:hypothetical protein BDP81DRAFT_133571 [Colletotrichum phormii]|uniref:Uncharacterized protein n=1 Tax=Colletotrichum phormii TaxID=359342 RepID=A0AAJ0A052_9PEZI|nr:uncharacterized protein BDP81DRAFT_133571 [Colletotrichum phormii]KAK1641450.1 hypothetical protein BDP81DRAFT_133571 [Colletotrichum phormii]
MGIQQRLKGAIDRTIAEEQARQEQARQRIEPGGTGTPRRSDSTSRSNQSPARRPRPKKAAADAGAKDDGGSPSNPDPAVFEAAFALDDSEEPSRAGTPKPAADKDGNMDKSEENVKDKAEEGQNGDKEQEKGAEGAAAAAAPPAAAELSPEVKMKLRKLEKLEKTYPGVYTTRT